jgi:cytochrome c oxidase assembly factor CtaG
VVAVALVVAPPLATIARRYDWAEALQFMVLALVAPGLFVLGAIWPWIGLGRPMAGLAEHRRRHPEWLRSALLVAPALACFVVWRTPAAVNNVHAGGWFLAAEAASLIVAGTVLWLECVPSPPLEPRGTGPVRIGICAVSMWTIWLLAYVVAMSTGDWYRAYRHPAGHGLSRALDQQVTAGVMWFLAAACFLPVIFWTLMRWLRGEEDADHEMYRLVREERRRSLPPHPTA